MSRYHKNSNPERVALLNDSESDDDFFLKGPSTASDKVRRVQNQVNEVVDVMHTNIEKVLDRGERLEDLQDKSDSLVDSASNFNTRASKLRKQMWWKNFRVKLFLAIALIAILIIIIVSATVGKKS